MPENGSFEATTPSFTAPESHSEPPLAKERKELFGAQAGRAKRAGPGRRGSVLSQRPTGPRALLGLLGAERLGLAGRLGLNLLRIGTSRLVPACPTPANPGPPLRASRAVRGCSCVRLETSLAPEISERDATFFNGICSDSCLKGSLTGRRGLGSTVF